MIFLPVILSSSAEPGIRSFNKYCSTGASIGYKIRKRLELECEGSMMEQMIAVYYAKGLLTLTGSEELLKTVK